MKMQKNLDTRYDPNLGKRILKISNTPPNSNPTIAKNEKMKNRKNLETRYDPNLGKRISKISNTPPNTNPTINPKQKI